MKKIIFVISFVMSLFLFTNVKAYTHNNANLTGRKACPNYELAIAKSDGTIETISCYDDYLDSKTAMNENKEKDLIIIDEGISKSKIVDAKYALLYLDKNDVEQNTNLYTSNKVTGDADNYINGYSGYGGTDAAMIKYDSTYKSYNLRISGYTGWVKANDVIAVVPISWVKSSSYYKITSSEVIHYLASNFQNSSSSQSSYNIGPKGNLTLNGKFYSYDCHYFYKDLYSMLDDYRDNKYTRSSNSSPYYNYYMYLPHRTKSNYTIDDLDAYLRNQKKFVGSSYGKLDKTNYSVLYGEADSFMDSERKFGANAISMFSLSLNESASGTSYIARHKNNVFGHGAYDSSPFASANGYITVSYSIDNHAYSYINYGYAEPTDSRYYGSHFGNKETGMNRKYASDVYWGEKAAKYYYSFDRDNGMKDYNYYQIVVSNDVGIYGRKTPSSSGAKVSYIAKRQTPFILLEEVKGENYKGSDVWYKVQSDLSIDNNGNTIASNSSHPNYNWSGVMYVPSVFFTKINTAYKTNNKYNAPIDVSKDVDDYTYSFYGTTAKTDYKVGYLLENTDYYTSSTLLTKKGTLLKTSFVTIIKEAKTIDGVNYLVVTDYGKYQRHWVNGKNIAIVNRDLLKVSISKDGGYISSYNAIDGSENMKIYTDNQLPIVSYETKDDKLYLKVQIQNEGSITYGYIDSTISNITFTKDRTNLDDKAPTINASDREYYNFAEYNILDSVTGVDPEDGDITSKIRVISNNIDITKVGTYSVTYSLTDSYSNTVTKTIKVNVLYKDNPPQLVANDRSFGIGTTFNPLENVKGTDLEDGDITSNIKVTSNNVDVNKVGSYKVVYTLSDSYGNTVNKTINVSVYSYSEANGLFMFNSLNHKKDNTFEFSGFMGIQGIDNKDVTHELIFINENTKKEYSFKLNNWKDYPYEMSSLDDDKEYNYSGGWFKSELDLSNDNLPNGDYKIYIRVINGKYMAKRYFTNIAYVDMTRRAKGNNREFSIDIDYSTLNSPIIFSVRDNLISLSNPKDLNPMYNYITDVNSKNGLYIRGTSNNIGVNYKNSGDITRYLILENKDTFKRYSYKLTNSEGDYLITPAVTDNCDKKYAWFEVNISKEELSKIDKGTYILYISEKVNDTYYGEIKDVRYLDYSTVNNDLNILLKMNDNMRMRLELTVK